MNYRVPTDIFEPDMYNGNIQPMNSINLVLSSELSPANLREFDAYTARYAKIRNISPSPSHATAYSVDSNAPLLNGRQRKTRSRTESSSATYCQTDSRTQSANNNNYVFSATSGSSSCSVSTVDSTNNHRRKRSSSFSKLQRIVSGLFINRRKY